MWIMIFGITIQISIPYQNLVVNKMLFEISKLTNVLPLMCEFSVFERFVEITPPHLHFYRSKL